MKLTIITINYNSADNTLKLLNSLAQQTDKNFQIVVVDNNSQDVDKLLNYTTLEDNLVFLRNHHNLGFSGGNNVGIKKALETGVDWVVLLNNDTWVDNAFISRLGPVLSSGKGIMSIPLVEGNKTAYCGKIEWFKSTLKHLYLLPKTYPLGSHNKYIRKQKLSQEKRVFVISLLSPNGSR